MEGVEAHAVDELRRALDVPDREIAAFAGLEAADVGKQPERARGLPRHGGDALVDGEPEQGGAHVQGQQKRGQRRGAGVAVAGQRDRHAVRAQGGDRRNLVLADEVEGARKQHAHGAGLGHGGDPGFVGVFDVIGREGVEAGGERCPVEVRELVGVKPQRQAEDRVATANTRAGLFGREGDPLTESVDRVGKPLGGDRRQHGTCRRASI